MNIHTLYQLFSKRFRTKRMKAFIDAFHPSPETTILDVGGSSYNWSLVNCNARITLLNLDDQGISSALADNTVFVKGDATDLPYSDQSFDIAFSNSLIEHLFTYEKQVKCAQEIRRVGKRLWVQTPARGFFIEPHLLTPFTHYLPKRWQKRLLKNFTVWGIITRPSPQAIETFLREVRLLNFREMQELFSDCEIRKEKTLFLTKSYIAIRG